MSKNIKKIIGYVTILQIVLYIMAVTAAAVIGGQTATYSGGETKTLSGGPTVTLSGGATRTLSGKTSLPTTTVITIFALYGLMQKRE